MFFCLFIFLECMCNLIDIIFFDFFYFLEVIGYVEVIC